MAESMGYLAAMAMQPISNIANTTTFSSASARLKIKSHDLKEKINVIMDDGLQGTRVRNVERITLGNVTIGGSITLEPTVVELENLMPFILGTASSSGTYVVADSLPNLFLLADCVAKVYTFTTRVDKAQFSASPGGKLQLKLDLVGTVMTIGNAGSFASASIPALDLAPPYRMMDMGTGVTINSVAYAIDKFELTIDNKIEPTFMQGPTATDLEPTDRIITLGFETKFTSVETTLQTDQRAGTGRAGSISFTNAASQVFSFTFGNLIATPESVAVPGRQHLRFPHNYQAFGVSTTKDIVATLPA